MMTKQFQVARFVEVTVDKTKFTPQFMEEFRQYLFSHDTVNDHLEHLTELFARGVISGMSDEFIEGYGPANTMGIVFKDHGSEVQ